MKVINSILFVFLTLAVPLVATAGGMKNMPSTTEITLFLLGFLFLIVNYPMSIFLAIRAKKKRDGGRAILSFLLGSVYVILWIVLYFKHRFNYIEDDSMTHFVLWFIVVLVPLFFSCRACLTVLKNKENDS